MTPLPVLAACGVRPGDDTFWMLLIVTTAGLTDAYKRSGSNAAALAFDGAPVALGAGVEGTSGAIPGNGVVVTGATELFARGVGVATNAAPVADCVGDG